MKREYFFILFIFMFLPVRVRAQSDISMSTHWNNRANYNPAFIARTDYLYLYASARNQWVGISGAPSVYNIQISEYFHSIRSAVGLSFVNDRIGATQAMNPMLTYAFRIAGRNGWALSMGLSGGLYIRSINGSLLEADNPSDPTLFYTYRKTTSPDLNVGFEFQNAHFIYGLSSTHLFSIAKSDSYFQNTNHRYGYAIYRNDEPRTYSYSFGIQLVNNYNMTIAEGNVSLRLKQQSKLIKGPLIKGPQEFLDFGITYRSSNQATLLCGIMVSPYLRIGYAYDQSLLSNYYRYSTHEIMLEYRIPARSAATVTRCGSKEFWYH